MSKIVSSGSRGTFKSYSSERILVVLLIFTMLVAIMSSGLEGGKVYAEDTFADISESDVAEQLQDAETVYVTGASISPSDSDETDPLQDKLTIFATGTVEIDLSTISATVATQALQDALDDFTVDVITLKGANSLQLTTYLDVPVGRTVKIQAASSVSLYSYWDYSSRTSIGERHIYVTDDGPAASTTSITFENVILEGNGYDISTLPKGERYPYNPKGGGVEFDSDYGSTLILDGAVIQGCDRETYNRVKDSDYVKAGGKLYNTAGGGVFAWGNLIIKNSIIKDNRVDRCGAGIYQMDPDDDGATGLEIVNCTIIGNKTYTESASVFGRVTGGGGVYSEGPLKIIDSRIGVNEAGEPKINTSVTYGGGVVACSDVTIINSIIARNISLSTDPASAIYSTKSTNSITIDSSSQVLGRQGQPVSGRGFLPKAEIKYSTDSTTGDVIATLNASEPIAIDPTSGWTVDPTDKTVFTKSYPTNTPSPNYNETVSFTSIATNGNGSSQISINLLDNEIKLAGILSGTEFTKVFGGSELNWETSVTNSVKNQLIQNVYAKIRSLYTSDAETQAAAEAIVAKFTIDVQRILGDDVGGYNITIALATNIANYILPTEKIVLPSAFTINKRPATIAVSSSTVTLPTNSASLNLTATSGLRSGDYIAPAKITVSRATAGTNTYDRSNIGLIIKDSSGADITKNYDLTVLPGQFTVNAASVPVTPPAPEDGRGTIVANGAAGNSGTGTSGNAAGVVVSDTTIESTPTPLSEPSKSTDESSDKIAPKKTPLATPENGWAASNLLLVLLTALLALVSFIIVGNRRKKDELASGIAVGFRVINIIAVVVAVVVFILTEDLTLPMQITDEVTLWMGVIAVAEVIITIISIKGATKTASNNA